MRTSLSEALALLRTWQQEHTPIWFGVTGGQDVSFARQGTVTTLEGLTPMPEPVLSITLIRATIASVSETGFRVDAVTGSATVELSLRDSIFDYGDEKEIDPALRAVAGELGARAETVLRGILPNGLVWNIFELKMQM